MGRVEQNQNRLQKHKNKEAIWLLWFWPPILTMSTIWEDVWDLWEDKLLKAVCRSNKNRRVAMHEIEQEATNENHIDIVTIISIRSNSKLSIIVVKLKMSSIQKSAIIPHNIDTGGDGNVMPIHIVRILFPKPKKKRTTGGNKNKSIVLKIYNKTVILTVRYL